jgi:sulfite exporter TauE/SafE
MDAALIVSAGLLGLAGAPHCTAMCGAPCAAAVGRSGTSAAVGFQVARAAGYALGGAVVASSVGALAALAQWTPVLRPLWTLLHVGALALGLWLLWQGRQPAWMAAIGRSPQLAHGWQRMHGPTRAALAGSLWIGWPCGLLQSALLVASLGGSALAGAAAMAAFAATSSAGLWLAPWIWQRLGREGGAWAERWAVRAAGAMLVLASGWSLGHGLWARIVAYCFPPA